MNKFEIATTTEMREFLEATETGRITMPSNTNLLLLNRGESPDYVTELEELATTSGRSLHLY